MEKKNFFFKILNEITFLNSNNFRKRQKERLQTLFKAILDGLLSRQAKTIFFKGIFRRFKASKFGPWFQKLLKSSQKPIFEASFSENRGS